MLWKIAICDDEALYCEKIKWLCSTRLESEKKEFNIQVFYNGEELLEAKEKFHILLLDVEMESLDGFEVGKRIHENDPEIDIIYITSHDEWVQRAFEVKAYRYIYKSQIEQLPDAVINAMDEVSEQEGIVVKPKGQVSGDQFYRFSDIYLLESLGDDIAIHFENDNVVIGRTLKSMLEILDERFTICSRGCVVNLQKVKMKNKNQIILRNEKKIKIARRREKEVDEAFKSYIRMNARKR